MYSNCDMSSTCPEQMGNARNRRKSNAKRPTAIKKARINAFQMKSDAWDETIEQEGHNHFDCYRIAKFRQDYLSQIDRVKVAETFPCRAHKDLSSYEHDYSNSECLASIVILKHEPKSYSAMNYLTHNHPAVASPITLDVVLKEIKKILQGSAERGCYPNRLCRRHDLWH